MLHEEKQAGPGIRSRMKNDVMQSSQQVVFEMLAVLGYLSTLGVYFMPSLDSTMMVFQHFVSLKALPFTNLGQ